MNRWLEALNYCYAQDQAYVLVSVTDVKGSAPRGVGSRMLITQKFVADTIGGGQLEFDAIAQAQAILSQRQIVASASTQLYKLGPELSQCCGGEVTLHYEYHPGTLFPLIVFGAGHVAQAVALIAAELPCHATIIDSRREWLDKVKVKKNNVSADNIKTMLAETNTFDMVERCADNAYYLVMTHSHELDFELIEAILTRGDSRYCGLIASKSKAARFRSRLSKKGFTESELALLTAPIGASVGSAQQPMEIAVAVCAEVLSSRAKNLEEHKQAEQLVTDKAGKIQ